MTNLEDRAKAYEWKFAHDQELKFKGLKFKATVRRNRLLGLWAAEQLGLGGEEARAYAHEVIKADCEIPGDDDVFRKIRRDFDAKGIQQSDHEIRSQMVDLMGVAVGQIEAEAVG